MRTISEPGAIRLPSYKDIRECTRRDIDKAVATLLREGGILGPPVEVKRLLEHLGTSFF